jgi:DNA primase
MPKRSTTAPNRYIGPRRPEPALPWWSKAFLDALAVLRAGDPAVVGLMGSTLSRYQADLLATHFDRVVLLLDGDDAGRQAAMSFAQTLGRRMSVAVISIDDGRQPDQLDPAENQRLLAAVADGRSDTTKATWRMFRVTP